MNIERTSQTRPVKSSTHDTQTRAQTADAGLVGGKKKQDAGTKVKLSQLTQQFKADSNHDVNTERLAEIKAKMDAGELHLDSDKIASALVKDIIRFS